MAAPNSERTGLGIEDELTTGREAGGRRKWYGKIKSHLTCGANHRRCGRSREALSFRGTSCLCSAQAARPLSVGVRPDVRADCRCSGDCGCAPPHDPRARPARKPFRECAAWTVPDRRRTAHTWCLGCGLCGSSGCIARTQAELPQTRSVRGRCTARTQARRRSRRRRGGDQTRYGDRQRPEPSRKPDFLHGQSWTPATACPVGPVRARRSRALASKHARTEQLGLPILRPDLDVAGALGCAASMDGRLVPSCSRAVATEVAG